MDYDYDADYFVDVVDDVDGDELLTEYERADLNMCDGCEGNGDGDYAKSKEGGYMFLPPFLNVLKQPHLPKPFSKHSCNLETSCTELW